jgi:hypothetical protein
MAANVAPLVCWDVVKRTSSFRRTSTHNKFVTMSSDAMNLEGAHSYRASGLAQRARAGVVPTAAGKIGAGSGYALATFDAALAKSPAKSRKEVELPVALAKGVELVTAAVGKSRKDLLQQALAKYSRARKAGTVKAAVEKGVKSGSRKERAAAMKA